MADNFDLRGFLTKNKLTPTSAILAESRVARKRQSLLKEEKSKVNKWKGTLGRELMDHKDELKDLKSNQDILKFLSKVEPKLSKEAKEYLQTVRSEMGTSFERNLQHLYNIVLAGEGLKALNAKKTNENMSCDYDKKEVRENMKKFMKEGMDKKAALSLLKKVYPGINLKEALLPPREDRDWMDLDNDEDRSNEETYAHSDSFDVNKPISEAGYTDDYEDDEYIGSTGSDYEAGIEDDPEAEKAAQKAMKAAGMDIDDEEEFEKPEDMPADGEDDDDDKPGKDDDDEKDKDEWHKKGQWEIKYDPETVTLEFDDEELQDYLNGFRRPKAAAIYLQRQLNAAQDEIDEEDPEYGAKKTYLQLKDGFYFNYPFKRSDARLIATVRRHKDKE